MTGAGMTGAARWVLWTTAWAVAELVVVVQCREPSPLCGLKCCKFRHDCIKPLDILCECPKLKKIHLQGKHIPKSVQSIVISNVPNVFISKGLTSELTNLRNASFLGIDKVTIETKALVLRAGRSAFGLSLRSVNELVMETASFSGYWGPNTTIVFAKIARFTISPRPFDFNSTAGEPSVSIQDLWRLLLEREPFPANASPHTDGGACASDATDGQLRALRVAVGALAALVATAAAAAVVALVLWRLRSRRTAPGVFSRPGGYGSWPAGDDVTPDGGYQLTPPGGAEPRPPPEDMVDDVLYESTTRAAAPR